jgi:hypothetical protein
MVSGINLDAQTALKSSTVMPFIATQKLDV